MGHPRPDMLVYRPDAPRRPKHSRFTAPRDGEFGIRDTGFDSHRSATGYLQDRRSSVPPPPAHPANALSKAGPSDIHPKAASLTASTRPSSAMADQTEAKVPRPSFRVTCYRGNKGGQLGYGVATIFGRNHACSHVAHKTWSAAASCRFPASTPLDGQGPVAAQGGGRDGSRCRGAVWVF